MERVLFNQKDFIPLERTERIPSKLESTPSVEDQKLRKACQGFEALLVGYMLKTMRETVPKSDFLDEGLSSEFFWSMFDEQLAQKIAEQQQVGLGSVLYRQLSERTMPIPKATALKAYKASEQAQPSGSSPYGKISKYEPIIQEAASRFGVNPNFIRAVIAQESGGRANAVSQKGAIGLMQLMSETAQEMGVTNPSNPRENILGGTKYLSWLLDKHNGDLPLALASYNAGPTAVEKHKGIPPYPETQAYVRAVLAHLETLEKLE